MDATDFFLKNNCIVGIKIPKIAEEYANLRVIEVLEECLSADDHLTTVNVEMKIRELKAPPIENNNDIPESVGGGYGFKDILGC